MVVRCVKGQGARSRRRDLQIKHRMMSSLLRTKCKTGRNCHSQRRGRDAGRGGLRFVPGRVDGLPDVIEVAFYLDRLESCSAGR